MTAQFSVGAIGDHVVYPGHPLVLAYIATKAFSCFEEADAPTSVGWPRMLGDSRIPGANGPVSAGLDVLRKLHHGSSFAEAVAWSNERWDSETSAAYFNNRASGHAQAEKVCALFDLSWWVPRKDGAILDETRAYRYMLWRETGSGVGTCVFLCLNPSTADEIKPDRTTDKCVRYARAWGYARVVIVNLFAYRTKDPEVLKKVMDLATAVGRDNDAFIERICTPGPWCANMLVCAWGGDGKHLGRDHAVMALLKKHKVPLHYLKLSTSERDFPQHPLYLKGALRPQPYPP